MQFSKPNSFIRTWSIGNKEVANIIFYADGEILAQTNCGYLEAIGEHGTRTDIKDIPEIEVVKRAAKLNLDRKDCFVHKNAMYIYGPLVGATKSTEVLFSQFEDGQQNYINAFHLTFTHNDEVQTLKFYEKTFTRIVHTGDSAVSKELQKALKALGFDDVCGLESDKMVKNADKLIAILQKAKAAQ